MKIELTPWQLAMLESLVRSEIAKQPPGESPHRSRLAELDRQIGYSLNTAHVRVTTNRDAMVRLPGIEPSFKGV